MTDEEKAHDLTIGLLNHLGNDYLGIDTNNNTSEIIDTYLQSYVTHKEGILKSIRKLNV